MKKIISIVLVLACAAALLAGCGSSGTAGSTSTPSASSEPSSSVSTDAAVTGSVATDGSTSMEKVIGALGEAFMNNNSGASFTYNPTGSGSGIKAVLEGRCDIGLSSRALKDEEKAEGLVETVLAYDGIAMVVNPENPVSDLSLEQIAASTPARSRTGKKLAATTPRSS